MFIKEEWDTMRRPTRNKGCYVKIKRIFSPWLTPELNLLLKFSGIAIARNLKLQPTLVLRHLGILILLPQTYVTYKSTTVSTDAKQETSLLLTSNLPKVLPTETAIREIKEM
jgi:hypothetical protein